MGFSLKKLMLCAAASIILLPLKSAFAQTSGDYRTRTTGNWNTVSTWERYDGSNWIASPSQGTPTNAMGAITIQASHTVTITANVSVDQVTVATGAQMILNSGVTLTIPNGAGTDLTVAGTFRSAGTINRTGTIVINNGGKYQHNFTTTAGSIPTATWSTGSTCEIIGYTTLATLGNAGFGQSFYNFTWNCPGQTNTLSMAGGLTTVTGNFSIASTGTGVLQLANTLAANRTLNVGSYSQSGGTLTLLGTNGSYYSYLNVKGNFSISGGILQKGNGNGRIYFTGTSEQTYTKTGGAFSGAIPITINNGAIVNFGNSVMDGSSGPFSLGSGATIITSHPNGLGASGTIQTTGTKSFSSGANYQFRGASTGAFTTTTANTINNLTINSVGTTLGQNLTVNGSLTLTAGSLILGNNNLTIASAGSISGYKSTSYIKTDGTGQLKRTVSNTAVLFPVGNSSYNPITFTNSGTSDIFGVRVIDGIIPATIASASQTVNRRWAVTETTANGSNLSVVAQYNSGEEGGSFVSATYNFIGFYNGTYWTQNTANKAGNNPYTFSSSTSFNTLGDLSTGTKYFAIGRDNGFIAPTKLVITSISPSTPVSGTPFSVTVQAQDANNQPAMVATNTAFNLTSSGTAGALSGTISGTISSGTNSATISGTKYNSFGTGTLTATRTSGLSLIAGSSSQFNVLASEPETQASAITFSDVDGGAMTINWTPAPGTNSIVFIKSTGVVNFIPVDGISYPTNTTYGSGSASGSGNYAIYSGSGNNVRVSGLAAGTTYYVAIYSYNGSSSFTNYLSTDPATENQRSLAIGDYRSKGNGDWGTISTWERWGGSTWATPTTAPTNSNGVITVRGGHTVNVATSLTVDQLVIETGGTVIVNSNRTLTLNNIAGTNVDAEVNGSLNILGTLENANGTATLWINGGSLKNAGSANLPTINYLFDNAALYEHARNGGTIPNAIWGEETTCLVTGITSATTLTGLTGETFYNFTWNCPSQTSALVMGVATMGVSGNFKIASTGTGSMMLNNTTAALTISGDYIHTAGIFNVVSAGTGTVNIGGNFSHTGGTLSAATGGTAKIIFNKAGNQTFTASNNTIGSVVDFAVNSGSTLSLGTSVVTGRSFTLSSGATLETAHPAGISSSGNTGAIQTSSRIFNTGADYIFNGTVAQITGNGLPATISDLTINNPAGVVLSSNCTVSGALSLKTGLFNVNTSTLTLNSDINKTEGSLGSASAGTVIYNKQSDGQTVISGTYGNLSFSNYNKVFESAPYKTDGTLDVANIFIAGVLSPGTAIGHNTAESIISFNGNSNQEVPASMEYFSLYLAGTGTKTIKASSEGQLRINWNLDVNAAVAFTNISSIYVVKNVWGSQALFTGAIPVTIGGDWKNSSTGTTVTGLYTYNGESSTVQEVGALNYKDLTITASRGESFPVTANLARGPVTVARTLTVGPGCELASNGNLTLLAAENSNANVAPLIGDATITGDVNVQSFIKGGASTLRGTRAMSAPISSTNIYEQLQAFMLVTGPTGVAGGFDAGGKGQPYAVTITNYNEAAGASQSAFIPIETLDDAANPPGMGFMLFFRGNRTNPSTKLNSPFALPESVTVIYKGPLNQGDIEIPVPNSSNPGDPYNGYLLAGNPYASTIDIQEVRDASTGINPVITIVKAGQAAATYHTVLNVSVNSGSRYIQPGQAFYVSAIEGGGILRFNESVKKNGDDIIPGRLLNRPEEAISNKSLKLNSASLTTSINSNAAKILRMSLADEKNTEEALIAFRDDFSKAADENDATYFSGTSVNLSSLSSDNISLAINTLPWEDLKEIPLNVNASSSGQLTLHFTEVPQSSLYELALKDKLLGTITPVVSNSDYNFQIDASNSSTYGADRLSLLINPAKTLAVNFKDFRVSRTSTGAALNWTTAQEINSKSFEIERSTDGRTFSTIASITAAGNSSTAQTYSFVDNDPVIGINYYRIREVSLSDNTYSEITSITWQLSKDLEVSVYPNPVEKVLFVKASAYEGELELAVFDLQGRRLQSVEGDQVNVGNLLSGTYLLKIKDRRHGNVIGTKKFVKK
ncbi:T9SS type A sorting domain-containing protein [Desertivirga arenae]|uniref:T9SS type A sorting domain-containing protein n=1 Tax=Desertivirga arenae TaxID=2810309 RepID=UPI001A96A591|nr:T9SS type A sorting domain-containing protein [Pedobacter sp. SYSU D00823]